MATSGNFSSKSYNGFSLYVEWSASQDINKNESSVKATVYVKSYGLRATAMADSYIIINGKKKNWTYTFNIADTSTLKTTKVTEYTVAVPHNADGTKSITIKANMEFNGTYAGTSISDLTATKTIALPTIPRASSFSIPSSVNTGSKLTISMTPSADSFWHRVRLEVDGTADPVHVSDYIDAGLKSYSCDIQHLWLPSSTSKKMTVYLYTYTSNKVYIARTSKTITVNVPDSVKPSVSSLTTTLGSGLDGKYVQGKSTVTLKAVATPGSGATLVSYIFKGPNINGTSSSYTSKDNTKKSSAIQTSGEVKYYVKVKDTRGRESDGWYGPVKIDVCSYDIPQVKSITAQRCRQDGTLDDSGTYARVTVKVAYSDIDGANTRTITLTNKLESATSYGGTHTNSGTGETYTYIYGSGNFATSQRYDIQAVVKDKYNTSTPKTVTLKIATRTINIARYGNGVAIGGLSTVTSNGATPKFECNWDATFFDDVRIKHTSSRCFEVIRTGMSDDIDNDGANETADIQGQFYIADNGSVTCRRRYSTDNGSSYTAQGYWQLRNEDMYISDPLTVKGVITTDARFGFNGAYNDHNFNIYGQWADGANHDILVRNSDGLTLGLGWVGNDNHQTVLDVRPKIVNIRGNMYVGEGILNAGINGSGEPVVYSPTTYERTYTSSPNMYITSNGVFGRSTSSSERYKTAIEDVKEETLNPYHILDIPVRQFKYNESNIPIDRDADDLYIGLIAEEVAKLYPAAAEYNEDGQVEMWNIKTIVPAMLKIMQDQQKEIIELKQKVEEIKK